MGALEGLIGGVLSIAENTGKAAQNVLRYALGATGRTFIPKAAPKRGLGAMTLGAVEAIGEGTIGIGKKVIGAAVPAIGSSAGRVAQGAPGVVSAAMGLASHAGTMAVGASTIAGNAVKWMFKDDKFKGQVIKDFDNLWTGKKMRWGAGVALTAGGLAIGAGKGVRAYSTAGDLGTQGYDEVPAYSYDGLAASATGDLTLSLHKLRRG